MYKEDTEITNLISASNFDVSFSAIFMFEVMISKVHNLPVVKWATYLPDPVIGVINYNPWDLSSNLPLMHPFPNWLGKVGHFHITNRMLINSAANMIKILFYDILYPERRFTTQETKMAH